MNAPHYLRVKLLEATIARIDLSCDGQRWHQWLLLVRSATEKRPVVDVMVDLVGEHEECPVCRSALRVFHIVEAQR